MPVAILRHVFTTLLASALLGSLAPAGAAPAGDDLPPPVQRVLDGHALDAGELSIHVRELGTGREVLAHNPDTPRNPASVLKLLTTYAALDELGPAHTWRTEVYLGGPLAGGVLEGDLILRGGGDPYLVQERFWLLLRELRRRGLERIEGDLVLDTSYFLPAPEDRGAFDNQPLRAYNVTPHALLVNFNVVRFWFEPASSPLPAAATRSRAVCSATRISCSASSRRCGARWAANSAATSWSARRRQRPSGSSR